MLYLVVCGNRFHGQSVLSVPQNIFPLLHREEKCAKPISLVPLHLEGFCLDRAEETSCSATKDGTSLMLTAEALGFSLLPPQPSWFLRTRQREKETLKQFCFHRGQETARTSLCFCKQNTVLFGPFPHCFLHSCWDLMVFSASKQQELLLIRWIILRVVQGITEVPVPTISTGAPGAITRLGVHNRHKAWFFLIVFFLLLLQSHLFLLGQETGHAL